MQCVIKKSYCGLQYTVMFCKWNISASKTAIVPWQTSAGFICSLKPSLWKKCAVSCFIWNTQGNKNRRQGHVISSQRWYRWRRFSFGENNSTTLMFFIFFSPYLSRWNHKREKQFLSFSILILQMKDFAQLKSSFDCTSKKIYCTVFRTSTVSIFSCFVNFQKVLPWQRCAGSGAPPLQNRWLGLRLVLEGWGRRPGGGCGRAECHSQATAASSAPEGCLLNYQISLPDKNREPEWGAVCCCSTNFIAPTVSIMK